MALQGQWVVAAAGFAFHYLNLKWQEERKVRIERVNSQVGGGRRTSEPAGWMPSAVARMRRGGGGARQKRLP
jgi:hypothetical protein